MFEQTLLKQTSLLTIRTKETISGFVRSLGVAGRQDVSTVHTVPLCSPKSFQPAVSPHSPLPVLQYCNKTADCLWDIEFQDLEMGHTTSQASHGLVLECSFSSTPATWAQCHRCWRHPGACSESQLIPGNLSFICSSQWIMSKSVAAPQWISEACPKDKTSGLW